MIRDDSKARIWAARFERFRRSGLTLSQFCRNEGVSIQAFYYWRKKIDSACASQSISGNTPSPPDSISQPLRFTIEARGVRVECQSESLETIQIILAWAACQQDSAFQQLIVRD